MGRTVRRFNSDDAAALARQYLEALTRHLNPLKLDNGDVMILPNRILPSTVRALASDLQDVLGGTFSEKARRATTSCGDLYVQSVAFGSIRDFNLTLKVGLLYSDRVVLWDILASQCAQIVHRTFGKRFPSLGLSPNDAECIATIASNVLSLAPLVEDGSVTVLPHPFAWSTNARISDRRAAEGYYGIFYSSDVGRTLATALSVANELNLHPYSVLSSIPDLSELPKLLPAIDKYISSQNQSLQRSYAEILAAGEFCYIDKLSVAQFYGILKDHTYVADELQNLIGELGGKTEQQLRHRLSYVRDRIQVAVEAQNKLLNRLNPLLEASGSIVDSATNPIQAVLTLLGSLSGREVPTVDSGSLVSFFAEAKSRAEDSIVRLPWV